VLIQMTVLIFRLIWSALSSSSFFQEKFDRFDYGLDPPPKVDEWCMAWTSPNIAQVVFIFVLAGLLLFSLISALVITLDRFWIFIVRGEKFITDIAEDDEEEDDAYFIY